MKVSRRYVFGAPSRQVYALTCLGSVDVRVVQPFAPPTITGASSLLWLRLTSQRSLLLQLLLSVRPHGISRHSFLVYLPNLPAWVTFAFGASRLFARLPAIQAFVFGFCPSGYDFAMASSLPHLAVWNLPVAMGFVGNYAPDGLSPQNDGMPVVRTEKAELLGLFLMEGIHANGSCDRNVIRINLIAHGNRYGRGKLQHRIG